MSINCMLALGTRRDSTRKFWIPAFETVSQSIYYGHFESAAGGGKF
jgi:hypothetical protein